MPTQPEIDAAVDHLRRVKNGENPVDVYGTHRKPLWFKGDKWTAADAKELAEAGIQSDQEDLADAYLAWTASREEAAKELAGDTAIVPVTYVDGGAMLPPKLAEDANAD